MIPVLDRAPSENAAFRRSLYDGAVVRLAPTADSERLVAAVLTLVDEELGRDGPAREAQVRLSNDEVVRRIGRLRKVLYTEPRFHEAVSTMIAGCGFDPGRSAFDPIRLRVVTDHGFENPQAAPVYYAHRDTWYANPQAMITWWVPLHDVAEEETFVFFPDHFARHVANNSHEFDYDEWVRDGWNRKIGWQGSDASALYPGLPGEMDAGRRLTVSARAGEILLFAGAHFHQTRPNTTGRTRFSLDFRTVNLDDYAQGLGAPNVDNRSRGSALRDYVRPTGP
jgi:hypothetical protein